MPETKLLFLRATSTIQFKNCHLLIINHLYSVLSEKKPGKNSKHRVHIRAYTLVQNVQCLQFTINRFHSKASPRSRAVECLITFQCVLSPRSTRVQISCKGQLFAILIVG